MKAFNLKEYLENPERKVVTRDGRKVRIICTDRAGLNVKPVVALITLPNGDEIIKTFWDNGIETAGSEDKNDLFFVSTKHEGWININMWPDGERDTNGIIYDTELDVPNMSPVGGKCVATIKIEWEE